MAALSIPAQMPVAAKGLAGRKKNGHREGWPFKWIQAAGPMKARSEDRYRLKSYSTLNSTRRGAT